jgi:hypothetical protein
MSWGDGDKGAIRENGIQKFTMMEWTDRAEKQSFIST